MLAVASDTWCRVALHTADANDSPSLPSSRRALPISSVELSAAAALSKVDGFQIYMKNCCDVGRVEAHFERSVTLDKSLRRAWNYATTLELSQAPWGYSPEEIGHVIADCTIRGK